MKNADFAKKRALLVAVTLATEAGWKTSFSVSTDVLPTTPAGNRFAARTIARVRWADGPSREQVRAVISRAGLQRVFLQRELTRDGQRKVDEILLAKTGMAVRENGVYSAGLARKAGIAARGPVSGKAILERMTDRTPLP